jgi:hypothetical protein
LLLHDDDDDMTACVNVEHHAKLYYLWTVVCWTWEAFYCNTYFIIIWFFFFFGKNILTDWAGPLSFQ